MGILDGKKLLITGVLTGDSLAFGAARLAQEEGADLLLTSFGRARSLTERSARRLPRPVEVLELDVTRPDQLEAAREAVSERFGRLDGLLHSIGFAPQSCLGQGMFAADWHDVSTMLEVSAYSLKALVAAMVPLLTESPSASVVGLDFDATVAWPGYDWMGVAKAAYESLARYLARDLGPKKVRVNLVAAGPVQTVAARSIPGFAHFEQVWDPRAPLGWDLLDAEGAVAKACVALLSDYFPRTTGEIIHVDGGFHAVGA